MDIPDDPQERKKWMMKLLQDYGQEFLIFEPGDQPNVFAAPEPECRDLKSGNLDPRELKSWQSLDFTLKFLQERYGLFGEHRLVTDCPVHRLHPLKGERSEDFGASFQLVSEGTIRFHCRRYIGCKRPHCSAKTNRSLDLYDLVSLLEGKSLEHARRVVSDYYEQEYGRKLGHFPKAEKTTTDDKISGVTRYAVPKKDLEKLFTIPSKGRGASARFVEKAQNVINSAPEEPYDGHRADTGKAILFSRSFDWRTKLVEMGSAARLFLWIHWRQAEAGSKLSFTDQEMAEALHVDRRTIQTWKQSLVRGGYLEISETEEQMSLWSANYAGLKNSKM
jgi:hypothetical protein